MTFKIIHKYNDSMTNGRLYSVTALSRSMGITRAMVHYYIKHEQLNPDYMIDNRQPVFKQESVDRFTFQYQQQRSLARREKRKFE